MLFVAKANSIKSSISKIEKQLDDIEKNADAEDGFEKIDEDSFGEDDLSDCEYRFRTTIHIRALSITNNNLDLKWCFPFGQFCHLLQPFIGVFTPPPNSK